MATPGDLLLHIRAEQMDLCFELAMQVMDQLDGAVSVVDEVHGFRYFDLRSMVGFVDGTENQQGHEAVEFTVIGDRSEEHTSELQSLMRISYADVSLNKKTNKPE